MSFVQLIGDAVIPVWEPDKGAFRKNHPTTGRQAQPVCCRKPYDAQFTVFSTQWGVIPRDSYGGKSMVLGGYMTSQIAQRILSLHYVVVITWVLWYIYKQNVLCFWTALFCGYIIFFIYRESN